MIIIPYFFRKLGKMSQNLSSAAVVIGTLRVKNKLFLVLAAKFLKLWGALVCKHYEFGPMV